MSPSTRQPAYNVEQDDAKWANTKAQTMILVRQLAMLRELITLHPQVAYDILGEIGRADHAEALARRKKVNGQKYP